MSVTVKEYLTYFRHREYPNFIAKEDLEKLENVERIFGELETKETILEICLSKKDTGCDYSIRIDVDSPYVKEYWYELDSDACSKEDIPACYFIDASKVIPGEDNHIFYDTVLVQLIGEASERSPSSPWLPKELRGSKPSGRGCEHTVQSSPESAVHRTWNQRKHAEPKASSGCRQTLPATWTSG